MVFLWNPAVLAAVILESFVWTSLGYVLKLFIGCSDGQSFDIIGLGLYMWGCLMLLSNELRMRQLSVKSSSYWNGHGHDSFVSCDVK